MRLIDLDYALEDMCRDADYASDYTDRWLEELPLVDAVPVIRCKYCKFHHDRTQCSKRIGAWFDDDYCNGAVRAERKEE